MSRNPLTGVTANYEESGETEAVGRTGVNNIVIILIISIMMPISVFATETCRGRFVNPITDICWSCLMPISIGKAVNIGLGLSPKKRDIKNPKSPVCACVKANVPVPGITVGFWEPTRLIDVTRTPYCMVNLGGLQLGNNRLKVSDYARGYGKHHAHRSFYHVHYYIYPLIYWLELITDFACLEESNFDVAYISELDPTWNDEMLQTIFTPDAHLFGNHLAQASCAIDCAAATIKFPRDEMYWCAGCWGNIFPYGGANADHVGGVQSSSLYAARILAKMHRTGLAQITSTDDGKVNGPLCRKHRAFKIKKSQYKLQMTYPASTSKDIGCWPLGLTDVMYSRNKEYPYDGQDWGYLVWRKRNCCLF